ncbi:MAG: hypothetical protein KAS72_05895 [Phycisphaerales bacterium]|nr:hypothetical protein [Phycisphaerales bacterium]
MSKLLGSTVLFALAVAIAYTLVIRSDSARHERELALLEARSAELTRTYEQMITRLGAERRIAEIVVTARRLADGQPAPLDAPGWKVAETDLLYVELDGKGQPITRRSFTIAGDVAYFDALTVKFRSEDVARGNPLRGKTLILMQRIYSSRIAPDDGIMLDTPGSVPTAYATAEEPSRFEEQVWERFWDIATNPDLAREMDVRVAQGEAVYKPLLPGRLYRLTVDAAGGMNLIVEALDPAVEAAMLSDP